MISIQLQKNKIYTGTEKLGHIEEFPGDWSVSN